MDNTTALAVSVGLLLVFLFGVTFLLRRKPPKLDTQKFYDRWQAIQQLCANRDTWPLAIINADKLLDDALKKSRYRGKTMGERLVAAQHEITNNDNVWFGHKLRNKLVHEEVPKLRKIDVKDALVGFREALRDLGALK